MTYDEALREIGVAPGSSQEEIRRAYLRLVKTRKPETDPEGFRLLREAFELLRHLPEASPEIRLHPRSAEKRPARQQAEPEEEVAAEPADVVCLILQLRSEGQADEAERIQERFQRRLQSSSRELSLLDDQTAALWQIVQEISGLSADFSMSTRVAISAAVLRGAPGLAVPRLLSGVEDGDAGWRMAAEIKDLPGLGSLYHDTLVEALESQSWRRRSLAKKPSWAR